MGILTLENITTLFVGFVLSQIYRYFFMKGVQRTTNGKRPLLDVFRRYVVVPRKGGHITTTSTIIMGGTALAILALLFDSYILDGFVYGEDVFLMSLILFSVLIFYRTEYKSTIIKRRDIVERIRTYVAETNLENIDPYDVYDVSILRTVDNFGDVRVKLLAIVYDNDKGEEDVKKHNLILTRLDKVLTVEQT